MTLLGDKRLQIPTDPEQARKIEPAQRLAANPWMEEYTHNGADSLSGVATPGESGDKMIVKEASPAKEADAKQASMGTEEAAEAAHLAGSAVVTGAVAVLLAVIAIPVSVGLGIAWSAKAIARRIQGK